MAFIPSTDAVHAAKDRDPVEEIRQSFVPLSRTELINEATTMAVLLANVNEATGPGAGDSQLPDALKAISTYVDSRYQPEGSTVKNPLWASTEANAWGRGFGYGDYLALAQARGTKPVSEKAYDLFREAFHQTMEDDFAAQRAEQADPRMTTGGFTITEDFSVQFN
jgi:hypothetical protein